MKPYAKDVLGLLGAFVTSPHAHDSPVQVPMVGRDPDDVDAALAYTDLVV
jgi:hypothetical protein